MGYTILVLWFCKKSFYFPPSSLESKFIPQVGQTWILIIIPILLVIRHSKHIFLIVIHSFDALVLQEKLLFLSFSLESKFVHQMLQTWILKTISILFVIGHYKLVLIVWIHGFQALVLQEMLLFPLFSLKSIFIP